MRYTKVRKTRMDPAKEAEVLSTFKNLRNTRNFLGKVVAIRKLGGLLREASCNPLPNSQFGSLIDVRLRVFVSPDYGYVDEELEVVYEGGEFAHRCADLNSTSANLREIAEMADGCGLRGERSFDELNSEWWELMFDEKGNPSLWVPEIIGKPAYKDDEEAE